MPVDGVTLDSGAGGATIATDTVSGQDYQLVQLVTGALDGAKTVVDAASNPLPMRLSDGSSFITNLATNIAQIGGNTVTTGAGAVATGTPRVTLASDDPAVVLLGTIDTDTGAIVTSNAAIQAAVEGTLTVASHAVTNAGTFATQIDGDALTSLQLLDNLPVLDGDSATGGYWVGIAGYDQATGTYDRLRTNAGGDLKITLDSETIDVNFPTVLESFSEDAPSSSGQAGVPMLVQRLDTLVANAQVSLDGDYTWLRVNNNGALWVAGNGTFTVDGSGVTQPVSGTVDLGATDNAVLDNIQTAVETIDNAISGNEMQVDVVASLPAGTNAIGKLAANSGVDIGDVDVLSIAAGSNLIGDVGLQPRTTGGLTMSKTISAASTNATSVKGSAGQIYGIQCSNINASARYLKLYNKASAPTVGTDTPVKTLVIPGNAAGAGFVISWPQGLAFSTGIAFALTTEITDAGTTGVAASELSVNIDYK